MRPVGVGLGGATVTLGFLRLFHLLGFGNDGGLGTAGYGLTGIVFVMGSLVLFLAIFSKNKVAGKPE